MHLALALARRALSSRAAPAPGAGRAFYLTDSLTRAPIDLSAAAPAAAAATLPGAPLTWYACGPTVYAPAHIGHARTYVALDIARRVAAHLTGRPVLYALGVTDIDDKIVARAREQGTTPPLLAGAHEAAFLRDLAALRCLPPTALLRVSEHIPEVLAYTQRLVAQGSAYCVPAPPGSGSGGSVYFSVPALGGRYGKLAPAVVAAGGGGGVGGEEEAAAAAAARGKRDARDFALWKGVAPSDGSNAAEAVAQGWAWASPWGLGRPGWHIECSAMTRALFGAHLDVHAGGIDLAFPHHCNECAQADAWEGGAAAYEWVRCWLHTGHVHVDGLKMSKSLKNFTAVSEMLEGGVGGGSGGGGGGGGGVSVSDAFRLWCLSHHYSSTLTYSRERLEEAGAVARRLQGFLGAAAAAAAAAAPPGGGGGGGGGAPLLAATQKWGAAEHALHAQWAAAHAATAAALARDLDTPAAMRALVEVSASARGYLQGGGAQGGLVAGVALGVAQWLEVLGLGLGEAAVAALRQGQGQGGGAGGAGAGAGGGAGAAGAEEGAAARLVEHRAAVKGAAVALRQGVKAAAKGAAAPEALSAVAAAASGALLLQCDELRDKVLPSLGWTLQDLPSGPLLVRKGGRT